MGHASLATEQEIAPMILGLLSGFKFLRALVPYMMIVAVFAGFAYVYRDWRNTQQDLARAEKQMATYEAALIEKEEALLKSYAKQQRILKISNERLNQYNQANNIAKAFSERINELSRANENLRTFMSMHMPDALFNELCNFLSEGESSSKACPDTTPEHSSDPKIERSPYNGSGERHAGIGFDHSPM
jgi:hypothetical protein